MKKRLTLLTAVGVFMTAQAEVLLEESFDFDDGSLASQAADSWKTHSGTDEQSEVVDGRLMLSQSNSEDVHAMLPGGPFKKSSGGTLFASFDVEFIELPSGGGSYFAHFKDNEFGYRARVMSQTTGAEGGAFRLGVTSKGKNSTAVVDTNLQLDTVYKVVIAMSLADASTTLWIDPEADAAGGVTTTDNGSGVDVTSFAFRQAKNIGTMMIDNLKVGTTLADVIEGDGGNELAILTQPVSQTALAGKTISLSVVATGTEPLTFQWNKNGQAVEGATSSSLELTGLSAEDAGAYSVTVSNDSGSVTSNAAEITVQDSPGGDVVTVKHLRSLVDENLEPSDTKTIFTAEGIVTTHTNLTGGSHSLFYFQDETAGIAVYFRSGKSSHPKPGDKVRVVAPIGHYNGLLQLVPDAGKALHLVEVLSSENPLPEPAIIDFTSANDATVMEALEGSLVVAGDVTIDSKGNSKFSGGTNYTLSDADGLTLPMRIDSRVQSIIGQPIPGDAVNVIGVLSQYMRDRPREGGYQLMPTRIEDISGPKLPTLDFTLKYEKLVRPGRPLEGSNIDHFLLPGETAVIEAIVKNPAADLAPSVTPTGDWTITTNDKKEVVATLNLSPTAADAGGLLDIALEAENSEGTQTFEWQIYVPSAEEQLVVITEIMANPTGKETDPQYNPLRRETPSSSNKISVEDEYIEIANLGQAEMDLEGWSLSDAVALRSNFYEGDILAKRSAVIVYGGRLSGSEPMLGEGVLALPATESSNGLGLNNSGDTITLRNADGFVIDRIKFGKAPARGSLTRLPGPSAPFMAHSGIAGKGISPGAWPSGAPFTEEPFLPVPEVVIHVELSDGDLILNWETAPTATYTVLSSQAVVGPFEPVAEGLTFDGGSGLFRTSAKAATQFFIIKTD